MEDETMTPIYFQLIYEQLSEMGNASWVEDDKDRIQLLGMDVRILEAFCRCLEIWNDNISDEDEENSERLRSVFFSLKSIWPEDFQLFSLLEVMDGTLPIYVGIQDFDPVFELEVKILQSKQQIEGWCRYSLHSLMMMQYKSSEFKPISDFLKHIEQNLDRVYICGAEKIVLLNNQFDILRTKIVFLERILGDVDDKRYPNGKENLQFLSIVGSFANSVACVTWLFWAIDDDDEIASKMNIVLFDMLQKFIPHTCDITKLYIILKSDDLRLASDSFLLQEAVESFIDFFFKHLATVLKDDFLFLRDRLLFLFTFLTDPPCENAEEGNLICSQIYAILHEDVYLFLSFVEMKEDFSDKKTLLSGFMNRIDIANARIRQLYRGSSGSQITLEVEEMEYDYLASIHRELSWIEKHAEWADKEQLQLYKMELRFLRAFLLCFATWDHTDEEIKVKLRSMITSFRGVWGENEEEGLLAHRLHAIHTGSITDWHPLAFKLERKIQQSKLQTEAWCVNLFQSSVQFKTSTSYMIMEFLDSILDNFNDLVSYKASKIVLFKKQIETLEEKLIFLRNFLKLAVNCPHFERLEEFKMFVQAFANDAVCLTFLFWTKDSNAESASETNSVLSHMLQKIKPATPDVARLYFGSLMAIYVQRSDSHMFGQIVLSFVELFLDDLVTHLKDDDFEILQDNIIFLLTFLNNPPNQNAEDSICSQIDVLFWEGFYGLIPFDDIKGDFSKKKVLLSDFMMKIEAINANIRCIYGKFPDSSLYNFPKVISPHFLDFLLQNLRNLKDRMKNDRKYVPFARYKIIKIEEELVSLCPFFIHIFDLKSELNETWLELVNVLHLTEHVIMSCISSPFVFDHPFWYHMAYLSDVFDEIKLVKAKLEKIKFDSIINDASCLPNSVGFINELTEQGRPSEINEMVVGFEDEKEKIIGMLIEGPKSLDIVSIVGMGGLGKTTLARNVFGSSLVKCRFDVFAFCSVLVEHNTRRLLLDILCYIEGVADISRDMNNDDLAHLLWKRLSRRKYLIVLDDIWNVSAWNEVKNSFPNDKNGSRVMFTTRSREVADKCRISCSPHQLRFMNEVESWELLQKKVFSNGISPPYLYDIGKQIAKNCKGLALAVVVVAGLLARTQQSRRWWSEVGQSLAYYLSNEGCMEVLELSYKHLPEKLKPCLIYLGAFPKDRLISVKRVITLWIVEGFIEESKSKSLEDVAREYFHDLVDRSFIIVGARNSSGGIKTFRAHDLIHDFCRAKCRNSNFLQLNHESALNHESTSSSSSDFSINNHYRVSMLMESGVITAVGSSLSNARTIHFWCEDGSENVGVLPLRKFSLVQVLDTGSLIWEANDINQLTSLIHMRYIDVLFKKLNRYPIPSSISNLMNIISLKLSVDRYDFKRYIHLPETFWRMNSLRYVKVADCILKFPDEDKREADLSGDQILDKVVSFSRPVLSTGKDVKRLLQRLPVVRTLSCVLTESPVYDEESIETLDIFRELESLKLSQLHKGRHYTIKYPSTLTKLTLERFVLPWADISTIAELHCLQILKIRSGSFVEPTLEMEDLVFPNLKFFLLFDDSLVKWNASSESVPCLEHLEIECEKLKELPPCFGEMSTLKRIVVKRSPEAVSSALRIKKELMELGIQLEHSISNY